MEIKNHISSKTGAESFLGAVGNYGKPEKSQYGRADVLNKLEKCAAQIKNKKPDAETREIVLAFVKAAKDKDASVRLQAVRALGKMIEKMNLDGELTVDAVYAIKGAFKDKDADVSRSSMETAGSIFSILDKSLSNELVSSLVNILELKFEKQEAYKYMSAAKSLLKMVPSADQELGNKIADAVLKFEISEKNNYTDETIYAELGNIYSKVNSDKKDKIIDALEAARKMNQGTDSFSLFHRLEIIKTLGHIGLNASPEEKEKIVNILIKTIETGDRDSHTISYLSATFAKIGKPAQKSLMNLMTNNPDSNVRETAARILRRILTED